jgi:hypothetical protein
VDGPVEKPMNEGQFLGTPCHPLEPSQRGHVDPSSQVFIGEALRIVDEGKKRNITFRVMGALAVRIHCLELAEFHKGLKRLGNSGHEFTDIDVMSLNKYRNQMKPFFRSINYVPDKSEYIVHMWALRHIYHEPRNQLHVDVFFDKLDMSHVVDFRNVLEIDHPTIPLAELLLEKLQIVHINEKDIKDSIALLRGHSLGENDKETINLERISRLLSEDWGFWYTVTMNLGKIRSFATDYCKQKLISESDLKDILTKTDQMSQEIESSPKSMKWKLRARVGTQRKWYKDVEDIQY